MSTVEIHQQRGLMQAAFESGHFEAAQSLAKTYLEQAEQSPKNWDYGHALHHANLMLGQIALQKGDLQSAKSYLLQAGRTPGSPPLNTFGPNMALAKLLLEKGEQQVVIEYLNLCKQFWYRIFAWNKIRKWKKQINLGLIPDFRANLVY
jgi:hypothetical protein